MVDGKNSELVMWAYRKWHHIYH